MEGKHKDTAKIVKWPKEVKPIPPDGLPGAQLVTAMVEVTKKAHQREINQHRRKLRESHKERRILYKQVCEAIRTLGALNELASTLIYPNSKKNR